MSPALVAHLNGGLGNQMFQYAAGRALAEANGASLYLDARSGFARDKVYKRTFELAPFPIAARPASAWRTAPFVLDAIDRKVTGRVPPAVRRRLFGTSIHETDNAAFMPAVAACRTQSNLWMRGFWQSERYFEDIRETIARELTPPTPRGPLFLDCARHMGEVASVAVGVRMFEEIPDASKRGVGGVTPIEAFNRAAEKLAAEIGSLVFFVFCTIRSAVLNDLRLPGEIRFVTHDDGFTGTVERLWLLTRCRHHIIANSSFYWWGAWLREAVDAETRVTASPLFYNKDTVPTRWRRMEF